MYPAQQAAASRASDDAGVVGARLRPGQDDHGGPGDQGAAEVDQRARGKQRHRQRAEELQGHRRGPARSCRWPRTATCSSWRRPAPAPARAATAPGERGEPRPHRDEQHDGGHPLADRDHPGGAEHREGERGSRRADLVGRGAARSSGQFRPACRRHGSVPVRRRRHVGAAVRSWRAHGRSMTRAIHTQNAWMEIIYTLSSWIWSCGTCAAWSRSSTRERSPTPPSSSASRRRRCHGT